MKQRSPAAVFLLSLITFGIYALVWEVKTKGELNQLGADIPTAWLLIVPLGNLYWVWKYCQGVEKVSNGQISAVLALILMLLLSVVGFAILQSEFNKLTPQAAGAGPAPGANPGAATAAPVGPAPVAPVEPTTGDSAAPSGFGQPASDNPDSGPSDPNQTPGSPTSGPPPSPIQ